ncbi:hypothetical protein A3A71_02070 [Candidatus Berkelbacteria bacterium RIFCSPLOWO2_01_FULL_50_28]|uniref:Uncharacterized protein n=1 Tax=Candidatus Berkelbacteria bacterium RIFCSPLOWO2_01_FULL_50_28 TaxID=1797471 RepID=A0A1F5EBZ0_9BACT|nr:MAG: hypothetical protein A2807_00465 [Candidatus Berkelbacteria bacterium RIFCSPHIGHO2_01_FULL_50_36]OGD63224.1 MAG: hypothetical protein A3F39_02335 [Candidatus Berkelbacteria bacterium RIFCSPHIGHO2_12_FULL_50_11]OGD64810.1 MAG: hypothetical protein A3A71_02070 [Candidatus Berkelbacteria bacterium RIFCSPLOWO2_01_FULL_50_28]
MQILRSQINDCRDCLQYHERSIALLEALDKLLECNPKEKRAFSKILNEAIPEQCEESIGRGKTRSCPILEMEVTDVEAAKQILSGLLGVEFLTSKRYSGHRGVRFWDAVWQGETICVYE